MSIGHDMKFPVILRVIAFAAATGATFSAARGATAPVSVEIAMMADGSVGVEGVRFTNALALHKALRQLGLRTPVPNLRLCMQKGMDLTAAASFGNFGRALELLQTARAAPRSGLLAQPPVCQTLGK